jgi:hypothetical protein
MRGQGTAFNPRSRSPLTLNITVKAGELFLSGLWSFSCCHINNYRIKYGPLQTMASQGLCTFGLATFRTSIMKGLSDASDPAMSSAAVKATTFTRVPVMSLFCAGTFQT